MTRAAPKTSDITLTSDNRSFDLHKFILAARTPYFRNKLEAQPETETWRLASAIPDAAFQVVFRYIYLGEVPKDLSSASSSVSEEEVIKGLDKVSKQLEVEQLWEAILASGDRRLARQRYQDEVQRALKQVSDVFRTNVVGHKMVVDTDRVHEIKWKHGNSIFADVLLRADEPYDDEAASSGTATPTINGHHSIPVGPAAAAAAAAAASKPKRKSVLYPAHKAMLIRSEYFETMFSGEFVESHKTDNLRIVTIDCSPPVLELILEFLYTENAACPLEHALDLLYAADMLFLDALKSKAAVAISTLGSGSRNVLVDRTHHGPEDTSQSPTHTPQKVYAETEPINIYDVIHAAWDLRVQRLEEFAARYLAQRLEDYIDDPEFQELISESASRIEKREETDTIELLDDIRYYLSERFRLRFEDAGLEEIMDEAGEISADMAAELADAPDADKNKATNGDADAGEPKTEPQTQEAHAPAEVPQEHAQEQEQEQDGGGVRTLDGDAAEDEFASDAINYQVLLGKIDAMLERLKLDA